MAVQGEAIALETAFLRRKHLSFFVGGTGKNLNGNQ
jgi:hypothetical protein